MILIITENTDSTSTEVIKWLNLLKKNYIRVHEDEVFEIKIFEKKIFLESYRNTFFLDDITSVWYRRGGLIFKRNIYENPNVNLHMKENQYWLEDYVMKTLESKRHINRQTNSSVNKLWVLEKAIKAGLDVPDFFLETNKKNIEIGKTITKTITEGGYIENFEKNIDGIMFTSLVEKEILFDFSISFFQEKIEKDFEIRSFFLKNKIWSVAIISQNDEQTKLDFRRYIMDKPNRNVRYKLPREIELKLIELMQNIKLDSGSIDFIKKGDKYYFLEVNPIGQFLGISKKCNYNLEIEVAKYL